MIYTITLNPTLDITYILERIDFGVSVRALEVVKTPGGKGINVSRALRAMGTDSVAMGMIGGYTGEEVLDLLHQEGLILQIIRIKNETRTNVIILGRDDEKELVIRAAGPPVEKTETESISRLILSEAQSPEIVVLSGSLPPGVSKDIYRSLIQAGGERGSRMILDSEGEPLRLGIEAAPYLIKPNQSELEELVGRELTTDDEIVGSCRELNERGIWMVVVSLGGDGAIMVTRDEAWRGYVPPIEDDTVGAGDSMVAGLVLGIVQYQSIDMIFKIGLACGVSAVMNAGPKLAAPATYEKAFKQIRVVKLEHFSI
jgi:1-phosphofructokinase family hexose kinase